MCADVLGAKAFLWKMQSSDTCLNTFEFVKFFLAFLPLEPYTGFHQIENSGIRKETHSHTYLGKERGE
jgi:hypothetical protein